MCVVHIQQQCREGGVSYPDSDARRGFAASAPECIKRCNSLIAASAMPSSRQLYHVRATQNLFTPLPIRALLTGERACLCSYICMYASISQKLHSGCPSCRPTNSVNHSITPLTKILLQKRQRRKNRQQNNAVFSIRLKSERDRSESRSKWSNVFHDAGTA